MRSLLQIGYRSTSETNRSLTSQQHRWRNKTKIDAMATRERISQVVQKHNVDLLNNSTIVGSIETEKDLQCSKVDTELPWHHVYIRSLHGKPRLLVGWARLTSRCIPLARPLGWCSQPLQRSYPLWNPPWHWHRLVAWGSSYLSDKKQKGMRLRMKTNFHSCRFAEYWMRHHKLLLRRCCNNNQHCNLSHIQ